MAPRSAPAFAILALLALASGAASQAPAPAPAPGPDCSAALTGLAGCLTYITPGSTESKPPKECCAGVKAAVASPASISCLCDALNTNYGIPLNLTRAADLPASCGSNPAAFSKCSLKLPVAPGAAPTEAPTSSGSTPATGSPSPSNSAATRSSFSAATLVLAAVSAPLLSYYYL